MKHRGNRRNRHPPFTDHKSPLRHFHQEKDRSGLGDVHISLRAIQSCPSSVSINDSRVAGFIGGERFKVMWGLDRIIAS